MYSRDGMSGIGFGSYWLAEEGGTFTLRAPARIQYGAGGRYNYKQLNAGTYTADNNLFGDPKKHSHKAAYLPDESQAVSVQWSTPSGYPYPGDPFTPLDAKLPNPIDRMRYGGLFADCGSCSKTPNQAHNAKGSNLWNFIGYRQHVLQGESRLSPKEQAFIAADAGRKMPSNWIDTTLKVASFVFPVTALVNAGVAIAAAASVGKAKPVVGIVKADVLKPAAASLAIGAAVGGAIAAAPAIGLGAGAAGAGAGAGATVAGSAGVGTALAAAAKFGVPMVEKVVAKVTANPAPAPVSTVGASPAVPVTSIAATPATGSPIPMVIGGVLGALALGPLGAVAGGMAGVALSGKA